MTMAVRHNAWPQTQAFYQQMGIDRPSRGIVLRLGCTLPIRET